MQKREESGCMSNIPVLEIFGPTIQGEGLFIGQKTMFVRTAGCDYRCSWCDSSFTWDHTAKEEIVWMTAEEIIQCLREKGGNRFCHVTISGGNPLLIASLGKVITLLQEQQLTVAIETQGSVWQEWLREVDEITISPKGPSSGMTVDLSRLDTIIQRLEGKELVLKVVIFNEEDMHFAEQLHIRYPTIPFVLQVGNNQVTHIDTVLLRNQLVAHYEALIEKVMENEQLNHVRVLPQLHTLVWGNKRGV